MTESTVTAILPKRPTSAAEFAEMVRLAAAATMRVRVTGSDSLPLTTFAGDRTVQTVSTLRMNKVVEHAIADMTVIVQAGMTLEALQRQLAWQNQWLPVDPPSYRGRSPGQRTVGGLIATNSLGPLRMGVGDWRLLVMGATWVDGAGNLIKGGGRTVKNVAGYSSPRMLIGSAGSLGAIAEVTLRTFARPADEQCVIFFCDNAQGAEQVIAEVLLAPTNPAYIEAVGGRTFGSNPLQLPTMKRGVAVVIGYLDRPQSCVAQLEILRALASTKGLESISQTAAQAGRLRLWLTSEPAVEQNSSAIGARIHMLSSHVTGAIAALETAAAQAGGSAWAVAEAAAGVVRCVVAAPDAGGIFKKVVEQFGAMLFVTQGFHATLSARTSGSADLVGRIKQRLDPGNTFGISPH